MYSKDKNEWYRLDTSAKIYPALESVRETAVFRISMRLDKLIDEVKLAQALEDIKDRFPYYNVHLKKGAFWNYFQYNKNEILVWPDSPYPCERLYRNSNNGYLYKVKYYDQNIAVEFFHVLTDGFGAMEFFKCLVGRYLFLNGDINGKPEGIIDFEQQPNPEEYEDAFMRVMEQEKDKLNKVKKRSLFSPKQIYQMKDKNYPFSKYKAIVGEVSVDEIKIVAKKYNATITEYLAALYAEALIHYQAQQEKNKNKHKNIAIEIPVNMRSYYPTICMRNFSLFVIPEIDPRKVSSLQGIIIAIQEFLKEHLTHEHLLTMIEDNCSIAKNAFVKHVPLDIKNLIIKYINNTQGSTQFSGTISNMGMIKLPPNMAEHVENVQVLAGVKPQIKRSCSVSGYNGKIYVAFGRSTKNTFIEKHVFTTMVKMGINVKIKSTS